MGLELRNTLGGERGVVFENGHRRDGCTYSVGFAEWESRVGSKVRCMRGCLTAGGSRKKHKHTYPKLEKRTPTAN